MSPFICPLPLSDQEIITLAHGSGGKLTAQLIEQIFLPSFANEKLSLLHDGAFLELPHTKIVFTTDSYVVQPIFFPGGDIGKLAVTGTLNDLAMCGASPLYLSSGFIIEEGFLQGDLRRIVASMKSEADKFGVKIVTGDTKVIERGAGNNIFINTAGIGMRLVDYPMDPSQISVGDVLIVSGDIGRHGMAIMAERQKLSFSTPLMSDCASLFKMVEALLQADIRVHCMRDLTRGGLATALVELAESSGKSCLIHEEAVPICPSVKGACEILGFDPLYVANEGRFIAFVPKEQSERALKILREFPEGEAACFLGEVIAESSRADVRCRNAYGTERFLFRLTGDQLPRIC